MSRTSQNDVSAAGCQSSLSFTQGFILGQLSVVLLISAFIKFFIFGEAPSPPSRGLAGRAAAHRRSYSINQNSPEGSSLRKKPSTSNVLRPVPSSSTNTRSILRKTYYNAVPTHVSTKNGRHRMHHSTHQPESLDWFNVLTAQTIAQYRQTAYLLKDSPTSSILDSLSAALNNPEKKPSFIDTIKVTDVSLGEEFPIFSNCRVIAVDDPNTDGGRLQALMDVDLSDDNLSLALETSLILNYPKPRSAILPVALSVSVVRFSGTLCISLIPASTPDAPTSSSGTQNPDARTAASGLQFDPRGNGRDTNNDSSTETPPKKGVPKTNLAFSFLPDYRLDLSVRSLIGSRTRLQDVPKVAQLIEARVHAWFEERVVEPRVQVVGLPDFWPRMGRTGVRAGEDAEAGAAATAAAAAAAAATSRPSGGPSHEHGRHGSEGLPEGLRYRGPSSSEYGYDSSNRSSGMFRMEDERQHDRPEREFEIPGSMPTP